MRSPRFPALMVAVCWTFSRAADAQPTAAPTPAPTPTPAAIVTTDTPREFPEITTPAQWQERSQLIRQQILVSAGLWPMPEKTPLHAEVSGKIERDGYSVEKVYLQPWPGFYLAGNLYRPLGHGKGPFPAILNPHGHWDDGRLTDTPTCSIPARCINFARQGCIAFSYDMVGYNDTHFPDLPANLPFSKIHRSFATNNPAALLWNISLMGVQTWNSIRALDFLASLPDVDTNRLACTGESGGGTQTFMLGAIDRRLAAQAPVVMVSHTMQGGCLCENMPGLRVEFSNMEIAAAAAPRPQIMVADTGDWTKTMMTVEGPAIEHIYQLLQAPQNLRYVRYEAVHNYNQTSREAIYQWFGKTLLNQPDEPVKELPYQKEPDADLRVFPDGKLPADAISEETLIQNLIKTHQKQLHDLQPTDERSLQHYKEIMLPAWQRTLLLEFPKAHVDTLIKFKPVPKEESARLDYRAGWQEIRRTGDSQPLKLLYFAPKHTDSQRHSCIVVLVDPQGSAPFVDESGGPKGLARELLNAQHDVAIVEKFPEFDSRDEKSVLFNTYNRTYLQTRVRDLTTICGGATSSHLASPRIVLCGTGRAGLWCLLAAPAADCVVADEAQLDVSDDQTLLAKDLFCPGIRNIDTFTGALVLAAPHRLLIHNASPTISNQTLRTAYKLPDNLKVEYDRFSDQQIVSWIGTIIF